MTSTGSSSNNNHSHHIVTTIIFDVDDTLYDVGTGFTASRTGEMVQQFMVDTFGFTTIQSAKILWDEYFERYHSTAKALMIAQQEGKFPLGCTRTFHVQDLANYWVEHLDYDVLGGVKTSLVQDLQELRLLFGVKFVAFSNGPRPYVIKVLKELGLWKTIFSDETLFAVEDVLPYCKPEMEAFQMIFDRVGVTDPSQCIMVEDSMKNIRQAKRLGMKTVLVCGSNCSSNNTTTAQQPPPRTDLPMADDPAVDVAMERIEDFRQHIPGLWKTPMSFPS